MKTQDISYLTHKLSVEKNKIEKLKSSLQLIQDTPEQILEKKHIIFVDDEKDVEDFDPEEFF